MRVFDTSFDYKTDQPATNGRGNSGNFPRDPHSGTPSLGDPDENSPKLRLDHELLWTKRLSSGVLFAPTAPANRRDGYLIFSDSSGGRHWYGSDAITNSYTGRSRPASLVGAIADLNDCEKPRYLDPPYTIGSAMIWPVRSKDQPTINQARGLRPQIADRMDLTLECIRRHYAREPESPLSDVLSAYADFFRLFEGGWVEFVDFFHFHDLVTPDYRKVRFFLPFDDFEPSGLPATKEDYIAYREATLQFIAGRGRRMAEWVTKNHPEIEVRCPWWRPREAGLGAPGVSSDPEL